MKDAYHVRTDGFEARWFEGTAHREKAVIWMHGSGMDEKHCLADSLYLREAGYSGGRVRIRHTENASESARLRQMILAEYPNADVLVGVNRGLCSYYAEHGGVLTGFETVPQKRSKKG